MDDASSGEVYTIHPHPRCARFNRPGEDTIAHRSWTGKPKHIKRLHSTVCQGEFSAREETLIARSKMPATTVEQLMSNAEETGETIRTEA